MKTFIMFNYYRGLVALRQLLGMVICAPIIGKGQGHIVKRFAMQEALSGEMLLCLIR